MKTIEDYIIFYIGCEALYGGYGDPERIVHILGFSLKDGVQFQFKDSGKDDTDHALNYFKPILRPLSDMLDEEFNYCYKKGWTNHSESQSAYTASVGVMEPEEFLYLLSKHLDLFGLIKSGLAINKTTLI